MADRLGAREEGKALHRTTVTTESMAFLGPSPEHIHSAGLVGLCFMLHHSTEAAQVAFERSSGLCIGGFEDFIFLASIPGTLDDLGMMLLV